jgi:hypothetical protein
MFNGKGLGLNSVKDEILFKVSKGPLSVPVEFPSVFYFCTIKLENYRFEISFL